ncbi:lysophospholipase, putative [Bodo saltans]|uniref:Lysophospholipase, putative n=1 Tax=Bodo saltans TaxID=75058 RepID=A0A0S4J016_BODSA|nr:lysophospholipase, putative [Bodo saltans]|eukprot:CUG32621.1 lysophospholipase, putative [Bodo saltans]
MPWTISVTVRNVFCVVSIALMMRYTFVRGAAGHPSLSIKQSASHQHDCSSSSSSDVQDQQEGCKNTHRGNKHTSEGDKADVITTMAAIPPISEMSVTQIKQELSTKYDITDVTDCFEKPDLVKRLEDSRSANAEVVKGPFEYGELLRIGNRVNPSGIVTLSHGLGDSARGWEDVAQDLASQHRHLLFLLPTAPKMPVTINMGSVMNAWYDIKTLSAAAGGDSDPNLLITANYVTTLARNVANRYRIPSNRIIFGGFSQGAALSIVSALTSSFRPAGLMVLSGYLASGDLVIPKIVNRDVPIIMFHGTMDNVLPLKIAEMSKAKLEEVGVTNIDFQTFPMAHSAHPRELKLVSEFIAKYLP